MIPIKIDTFSLFESSIILINPNEIVLFPAPVLPTMPTFCYASMSNEIP